MTKASQFVLLCEDRLQDVVACRFLREWGVVQRTIRVIPYPRGGSGGAGEKHVRDKYANELKAWRARSAHATTALIVMIDADTQSVEDRQQQLGAACSEAELPVPARGNNDAVVHIIPRRNIETWLAYLDGVTGVVENTDYTRYSFRGRESDSHPMVKKLADQCKKHRDPGDRPSSLVAACGEFERMRSVLA